jgi:hypothetical protein
VVLRPVVDEHDATDIAYIYDMRREESFTKEALNLVWFIVVPATNIHYSCSYQDGFSDFKVGDGVRLIHTKSDEDGADGFIIGLHGPERGKVTSIWNFNMDNIGIDLDDDKGSE